MFEQAYCRYLFLARRIECGCALFYHRRSLVGKTKDWNADFCVLLENSSREELNHSERLSMLLGITPIHNYNSQAFFQESRDGIKSLRSPDYKSPPKRKTRVDGFGDRHFWINFLLKDTYTNPKKLKLALVLGEVIAGTCYLFLWLLSLIAEPESDRRKVIRQIMVEEFQHSLKLLLEKQEAQDHIEKNR